MKDFFFYDTETSGSNVRHDQVLQFAGILTDGNLVPKREMDIFCKPDPHVIPHPKAMVVTGLMLSDVLARPMSHMDLIHQAYREMDQPRIFIGHNIMRFDEEMMRHEFYKTLHDPYVTSSAKSGRMDTLPLLRACWALRPEMFNWQMTDFGQPSFKLEVFAAQNAIEGHNAHDALGDVRANIALAKRIRDGFPELWESALMYSSRSISVDRMKDPRPFLTVTRTNTVKIVPCVAIATEPNAPKDYIGFNLDYDPLVLKNMSPEQACQQYREERSLSPLLPLKTGKMPLVLPLDFAYDAEAIKLIEARAERVVADVDLKRRAIDALSLYKEGFEDSPYPEDKLYSGGFIPDDDKKRLKRYHTANGQTKAEIAGGLEDPRLRGFATRDLFVNHPEVLSPAFREKCRQGILDRLTTREEVPWVTLPVAYRDLETVRAEHAGEEKAQAILADYGRTLDRVVAELGLDKAALLREPAAFATDTLARVSVPAALAASPSARASAQQR